MASSKPVGKKGGTRTILDAEGKELTETPDGRLRYAGGATLYLPRRALLIHATACDGRLPRGEYLIRGESRF